MMASRFTSAVAVILVIGWVGMAHGAVIPPEAVAFNHPDEVIRGEGFLVLADRRVFAVMAFLNAMGFDEEAKDEQMHPVRAEVRQRLQANLAKIPEKAKVWRAYYKGWNRFYLETYNYQDFSLSLSADYPFKQIRPDSELGYRYTAVALKDFPQVLNDFWASAGLAEIWEEVNPEYQAELRKYDLEKMNREMTELWRYLRMQRKDAYTLVSVPNLLDTHYSAIGAHYDNYYYTVESPGAHSYGLNTHEYLHSIVNPIVKAHYDPYRDKLQAYLAAGRKGPLSRAYGELATFTWECLVRAVDERLRFLATTDPRERRRIEAQIERQTNEGLTLTRPFYALLGDFEKSDRSFEEYVPVMLERLSAYRAAAALPSENPTTRGVGMQKGVTTVTTDFIAPSRKKEANNR